MNLKIDNEQKLLSIWFSRTENPVDNLPKDIEKEVEKYKSMKYRVCMYQSGNDDIKSNLLSLLMNNVS